MRMNLLLRDQLTAALEEIAANRSEKLTRYSTPRN